MVRILDSISQMNRLMPVVLAIAVAVMLGGSVAQATLVAKWNFNNLNDSSNEDKENNKIELQNDAKLADGMLVVKVPAGKAAATVKVPDNSEILFEEKQEFTVWVRLRILTKASGKEASFYFITNEGEFAGWMFRPEDRANLALRARGSGGGKQIFNVHGKTDNNDKYGDGKFHEFAFVRTKGEGFVWIDGEIDGKASTAGSLNVKVPQYSIWQNRGLQIDGLVEEMRLYDTALDDKELDAIEPDPLSVDPIALLATTWGSIKHKY